jgi:hypothetical protein
MTPKSFWLPAWRPDSHASRNRAGANRKPAIPERPPPWLSQPSSKPPLDPSSLSPPCAVARRRHQPGAPEASLLRKSVRPGASQRAAAAASAAVALIEGGAPWAIGARNQSPGVGLVVAAVAARARASPAGCRQPGRNRPSVAHLPNRETACSLASRQPARAAA